MGWQGTIIRDDRGCENQEIKFLWPKLNYLLKDMQVWFKYIIHLFDNTEMGLTLEVVDWGVHLFSEINKIKQLL